MKPGVSIVSIVLIAVSALVILFIIITHFSATARPYCPDPDDTHFYVLNNDMNTSHTITISVNNSSHQIASGPYELAPGDPIRPGWIRATVHQPATGETNFTVTFIVDGNRSSHFEQIAYSANCSELFSLDPRRGVVRSYDSSCADQPCAPEPKKFTSGTSGYPNGLVIDSFGVTTLRPQDIGVNTTEELDARLQKVADDSNSELDPYYYPSGPVIGHGHDVFRTMTVMIEVDQGVNQSAVNGIYYIIERNGEKNGINDIPCKFLSMGLMKLDAGSRARHAE
jgi:hypothetical protein